jgi:hypothetical protein
MWGMQKVFVASLSVLCLLGGAVSVGGEEIERPGSARAADVIVLTDDEVQQGFVALFDGVSFDGWKHGGNWEIQDGAFARVRKGGSLTYVEHKVPDNFELRFEWKVSKGCNSGVYYRPGQVEYQELLRIRGGNLAGRGGQLWLQDHGADVWFRNLRWREIPPGEELIPDPDFQPLPIPPAALAKEAERVKRLLENAKSKESEKP